MWAFGGVLGSNILLTKNTTSWDWFFRWIGCDTDGPKYWNIFYLCYLDTSSAFVLCHFLHMCRNWKKSYVGIFFLNGKVDHLLCLRLFQLFLWKCSFQFFSPIHWGIIDIQHCASFWCTICWFDILMCCKMINTKALANTCITWHNYLLLCVCVENI